MVQRPVGVNVAGIASNHHAKLHLVVRDDATGDLDRLPVANVACLSLIHI